MTGSSPERTTLGYATRSEEDLRSARLDDCADASRRSNLKAVWMMKFLPSNYLMLDNRTQRLTKLYSIGVRGGGMKQIVKIDGETRVPPGGSGANIPSRLHHRFRSHSRTLKANTSRLAGSRLR